MGRGQLVLDSVWFMFRRDWATGIDYKADIKVLIDSYMRVGSNTCYILVKYTIHNTGSRTIRVIGCFVGCLSILLILDSSTTLALEQLFGYSTTCCIEWVHVPSLFTQTQNTKTKSCLYISRDKLYRVLGIWAHFRSNFLVCGAYMCQCTGSTT